MTQAILTLILISAVGLLGLLGAIFDWDWIYRSRGAALLTRLVGRPVMRVLTGIAGVLMMLAPWVLVLLQ